MKLPVLVCLAAIIVVAFAAPKPDDSGDYESSAADEYGSFPYGYYYDGYYYYYEDGNGYDYG